MRLAHIRSGRPGEINETLFRLAGLMEASGLRVVGAVQTNADNEDDSACDMDLRILPGGPTICISQKLGPGSSGCRLDASQLEAAVHECSRRLAAGADLLIVNKFGAHEADGRGFRDLIGAALAEDVPVIVGVSPVKLDDFLDFSGGLSEELPCDMDAITGWCRN